MRKHVFVDLTGRRRQAAVALGAAVGVMLLLGLITVAVGLLNSSPVPLPGWPESVQRGGAVEVAPPPAPTPAPEASPRPKSTTATPAVGNSTPEPSRSRGNGHGRPTKSPGKT